MTKEEKLDTILDYYKKEHDEKNSINTAGMLKSLTDNIPHDERYFYELFLESEGMIKKIDKEYRIDYKGYFFEGYVNEMNRLNSISVREAAENEILIRNARIVAEWTPKAAKFAKWAAVAAFLLFLMEIVKYFFPREANGNTIEQIGIFF